MTKNKPHSKSEMRRLEIMKENAKCELCGSPVKVVGHTTKHYEPIEAKSTPMSPDGMAYIVLTSNYLAIVDADLYEELSQYNWSIVRKGPRQVYAATDIGGKKKKWVYMHRMLMESKLTPERPLVDHINGITLDNRLSNLRPASHFENAQNCRRKRIKTSSQYRGVSLKRPGQWVAQIVAHKKHHFLGSFKDELSAAKAYDEAVRRLHGEFAKTNF